jgi:hypothetical protein
MTALDGKRKKRRGAPVRRRVTRRERQLEIAINNISSRVALFNAAGRLVLCNKRYIDMYNLSPDVVKPGCPLKELLRHRYQVAQLVTDPDEVGCALLDSIANGETVTRLIEARDGRVARAVSRPLPGGGWVATHEISPNDTRPSWRSLKPKLPLRPPTGVCSMRSTLCLRGWFCSTRRTGSSCGTAAMPRCIRRPATLWRAPGSKTSCVTESPMASTLLRKAGSKSF